MRFIPPEAPDPYDQPKLKRGVYRNPADPPGWISYLVVGSDGDLLGRFGMRAELLDTALRRDAFERRLRKFQRANDVAPSLRVVRRA